MKRFLVFIPAILFSCSSNAFLLDGSYKTYVASDSALTCVNRNLEECSSIAWGSPVSNQYLEKDSWVFHDSMTTEGWIKKEDIINVKDMSVYTHDLPINEFRYTNGHLDIYYKFVGNGKVEINYYDSEGKHSLDGKIFFGNDILQVRYKKSETGNYTVIDSMGVMGLKDDKFYALPCELGEKCEIDGIQFKPSSYKALSSYGFPKN